MARRGLNPNALPASPTPQEIRAALEYLYALVGETPVNLTTETTYTTTGAVAIERIIANNTAPLTINLHASPADGDEVWIIKSGSSILVKGNGNTIDSAPTLEVSRFTQLLYSADHGEWIEMAQSKVEIAGPLSAFGDLRTIQLSPVFQGSFEYTVSNTALNTNTIANTGTVTQATGMALVGTGTTTASTAELKSKQHARYRAGLGGLTRFTTIFSAGVAGTEQFVGIMDEAGSSESYKNGLAVGYDGTTFGFHRFQNDVLTTVAQASWDDPLDGTGASGMTLNTAKLNVWEIRYQYLGGGAMYLYVEDDSTGGLVLVHTIDYANANTTPSTYNPNYHFTIWANNGGTTSDIVTKCASYAYFIEGHTEFHELHQLLNSTPVSEKTSVTTEVAIVTIRNKAQYASKTNYVDIILEGIDASIEASAANNLGQVRLVKNATLGGTPSYADISATNSVVDKDTAGTTVTGGTQITAISLAGKNDKIHLNMKDQQVILNPGETLTLAGLSANSATLRGSMLWRELF